MLFVISSIQNTKERVENTTRSELIFNIKVLGKWSNKLCLVVFDMHILYLIKTKTKQKQRYKSVQMYAYY